MLFEVDSESEYPPRSFFGRLANILLQPAYEWRVIDSEANSKGGIISNYVAPLLLICGTISSISHYLYAKDHLPNPSDYLVGILILFAYGICILSAYIYSTGLLISKLSANFGGDSDDLNAFKLSAYGITPIVIALLFSDMLNFLVFDRPSDFGRLISTPVNVILILMVIYGIYTMAKGAQFLLSVPKSRIISFSVALVLCMAITSGVFVYIGSKVETILVDANLVPDRSMIAYEENERTQRMIEDTEELRRSIERMNDSMRPRY